MQPLLGNKPDKSVTDGENDRFEKLAGILDDELSKHKFLVGDDVTIADIAVMAPMHLHEACDFPIGKYKNLQRWMGEVEKLDCWKKTQGAVEKALLPNKVSGRSIVLESYTVTNLIAVPILVRLVRGCCFLVHACLDGHCRITLKHHQRSQRETEKASHCKRGRLEIRQHVEPSSKITFHHLDSA